MSAQEPTEDSKISQMFSEVAPKYDLLNRVLSFGRDARWRKMAAGLAQLPANGAALDICSGTGDMAIELCRQVGQGIQVQAADFSREMLALGQAKAKRLQLEDQISFQVADAKHLPFEDEVYDVVTIAFGLRNIDDRERALREFLRVTKPGGRFVCLEFTPPSSVLFKPLYYGYLKLIPIIAWLLGAEPTSYRYLGESIKAFPCPSGLSELITKAGWQEVDYQLLTFSVVAIHSATKSVNRGS